MEPIGVYVHFPWCLKKCPYCDFVSFAKERDGIEHERYADAILAELDRRAGAFEGRTLATVFFGGGTPSLWAPQALGRVLAGIRAAAARHAGDDVEVTVECNPSSLDEDRARALVDVGVNRLSVGVQGLEPERLRFLGRLHDAEGGLEAVRAALRAGVPRVSADLIYGVAVPAKEAGPKYLAGGPTQEQSPSEAAAEARRVAETGVTHVSAYSLTIEPGTQFGELSRRGRLPIANEDGVAETFFAIEEALGAAGLGHYEISNYAREGHEARHNLGYWRGHDYVGLGCAAFGTVSGKGAGQHEGSALRYRNVIDPARYMRAALAGEAEVESEEPLDPETRLRERIMLGLRLREGFDLERSAAEVGAEAWTPSRRQAAERLVKRGKLTIEGGTIRVPRNAWVLADGIAAELF
ncbi:radical SAM family heme chaperone HemW [Polyangium sp. y55x31]|uniref:radical SAM family heme chaperone HemW n=1 Tax=Polyangium sp. y55x31 TaxID=3042688 RepID=UPI0024821C6F|nr:radical SAM family heme chaperone HemW [Polyangium sp. y55x31]MDI1475657.1 radical SAM family heme chaperone HemW [Polyangium sp. y55x31]